MVLPNCVRIEYWLDDIQEHLPVGTSIKGLVDAMRDLEYQTLDILITHVGHRNTIEPTELHDQDEWEWNEYDIGIYAYNQGWGWRGDILFQDFYPGSSQPSTTFGRVFREVFFDGASKPSLDTIDHKLTQAIEAGCKAVQIEEIAGGLE